MCFISQSTHKVAKHPIKCYKVMNYWMEDKLYSLFYRRLPFKIGDEICAAVNVPTDKLDYFETLEGEVVHSYTTYLRAKRLFDSIGIPRTVCIVECEIPKGVDYWVNNYDGEYASKKVIIKNLIEIN